MGEVVRVGGKCVGLNGSDKRFLTWNDDWAVRPYVGRICYMFTVVARLELYG